MCRFLMFTSLPALMFALPVRADDLKTADEVIEKYIQAIGGREKIDSMKTVRMSGKMIQEGGIEIAMTIESKRPNKFRAEFSFQGMTGIHAFDGEEGWQVMPFMGKTDPEKMAADDIKIAKRQADLDGPLYDYKKKGNTVELLGTDEFEGTPAYKLKVTTKDGDVEYHFLDKEVFLEIGEKSKLKVAGSEVDIEKTYSDFKDVEGRMLPHSLASKAGMGGGTMKIEKIEINPQIDDLRFAMPKVEKKEPEGEKKEDGEKKPGGTY